ncbi:sodium-dependent glucose transporter 1-like [Varroa destructor]|uniref:Major facilitator superfamily domain-containing protein 4A n=1 Tax=Varroa destructor TaxID=109461 RepID=A0A7M7J8U8_VARDE|nr:sodium-dependent glucose transporter 1-like [Varroa destructor]
MIFTPKTIRIWQTVNLTMSVFAVGLCIGLYGTSLLDLAEMYDTRVDIIVYILSSRSAGSIVSCFIAGTVFRYYNIQLVVMLNTFIGGLCLIAVPVCPSLALCHITCFVLGFTIGLLEVGCNVWLITVWKEKSAAMLQFYHFMFGVGAMLSPFGAEPFLSKKRPLSPIASSSTENATDSTFNRTTAPIDFRLDLADFSLVEDAASDSRIFIPFAAFGAFYAICAVLMFLSYLVDSADIRQNEKKQTKLSDRKVSRRMEFIIIFGLCIYVLLGVASEQNYASMISVYVIGSLDFSKSSGAFLVSVFWAAFTFSRIVATGLSIKVNPMTMLCGSHIIVMFAAVTLTVLPRTEWILWSMTALYAFGLSPFFGNVCAWALQYVFLGHNYMAAIMMFVCIGAMMPPIILAPFIESHPIALMFSNIALAIIMTATAIGLLMLGRHIGKPLANIKESHQEYDPVEPNDTDL